MSAPSHRRNCRFQLLRYVPDPVRNEFVNIGVILREDGKGVEVKFTHDWRRIRCLDPDADTAVLEGMEAELRQILQTDDGRVQKILEEALSLNVQWTEPKAYLAESLTAGLEELMKLYVEMPKRERESKLRGRAAIQAEMRGEFERAGVWDLMRKHIRAADYTRPGDPLRLDAGYRPNGVIRIFHAVSLDPGVEAAKILAFSSAALHAGVERIEKAKLDLTAIIEPASKISSTEDDPERHQLYRFGIETMEEHHIRVLTTTDLPRIAETARHELHIG